MKTTRKLPVPIRKRGRKAKYPFATMKPGESFQIPGGDEHRVRSAASYHTKTYGRIYTVQEANGSYHCWRLS